MTTPTAIPDVKDDPFKAATWLVDRHPSAAQLVTRVNAWTSIHIAGVESAVDLDVISEGIHAYDKWATEWDAYAYRTPPPTMVDWLDNDKLYEQAYDRWQAAGPPLTNPFAVRYGPMSGGEKRLFRMLGVFSSTRRIEFNVFDTSGVSFQCCTPGMFGYPAPHTSFAVDWAMLVVHGVSQ